MIFVWIRRFAMTQFCFHGRLFLSWSSRGRLMRRDGNFTDFSHEQMARSCKPENDLRLEKDG